MTLLFLTIDPPVPSYTTLLCLPSRSFCVFLHGPPVFSYTTLLCLPTHHICAFQHGSSVFLPSLMCFLIDPPVPFLRPSCSFFYVPSVPSYTTLLCLPTWFFCVLTIPPLFATQPSCAIFHALLCLPTRHSYIFLHGPPQPSYTSLVWLFPVPCGFYIALIATLLNTTCYQTVRWWFSVALKFMHADIFAQ